MIWLPILLLGGAGVVGVAVALSGDTSDDESGPDKPENPVITNMKGSAPPTSKPPTADPETPSGGGGSKPNKPSPYPNGAKCNSLGFNSAHLADTSSGKAWTCSANSEPGQWLDPNWFRSSMLWGDYDPKFSNKLNEGERIVMAMLIYVYRNSSLNFSKSPGDWDTDERIAFGRFINANHSKLEAPGGIRFQWEPGGWVLHGVQLRKLYQPWPRTEIDSHKKSSKGDAGAYPVLYFPPK